MAFKNNLRIILKDLSDYKRDTDTIMQEAIVNRLDKVLNSYEHDLELSGEYLRHRDNLKLMNKINRS